MSTAPSAAPVATRPEDRAGAGAAPPVAPRAPEAIAPQVRRLAWPVIGEQILQTLVGVVDVAMVGRLGAEAIAGVGTATQLMQLAISAMGAVGVGTTVLVARATGAGMWLVRLPTAYLLGIVLGLGLPGVYLTSTFDAGLRALLNHLRFRSGHWRRIS